MTTYLFTEESDITKKSVVFYIDLLIEKAFVIEIQFENILIAQVDTKKGLQIEVKIESAENMFKDDFFMKVLHR